MVKTFDQYINEELNSNYINIESIKNSKSYQSLIKLGFQFKSVFFYEQNSLEKLPLTVISIALTKDQIPHITKDSYLDKWNEPESVTSFHIEKNGKIQMILSRMDSNSKFTISDRESLFVWNTEKIIETLDIIYNEMPTIVEHVLNLGGQLDTSFDDNLDQINNLW